MPPPPQVSLPQARPRFRDTRDEAAHGAEIVIVMSICALHGDLGFLLSPADLVVALIAVIIANDAMGTPLTALWTAIPLSDPEDFQAGRPVRASLDPYGPSGEAQTFVAWSVVVVHTEVIRHA